MQELEKLKKSILEDYPHLAEQDKFTFSCGQHRECFNKCCSDVNIFLTPYDVLRMRTRLGLGSADFLSNFTLIPFDENLKLPVPLLELDATKNKSCPFVKPEEGCTIYSDRPSPCRMYPVGMGSPGKMAGDNMKPFFFLMQEDVCKGYENEANGKPPVEMTIGEWITDQGLEKYLVFNEMFKEVTLHPVLASNMKVFTEKHVDMYWMALYDLDRFRRFVFESTLLNRFEISKENQQKLKINDEELLQFGFKWVLMALYGEKTIPVKPEAQNKLIERHAEN